MEADTLKALVVVSVVLVAAGPAFGGFVVGYSMPPSTSPNPPEETQPGTVRLSDTAFSGTPAGTGKLEFNLTSTYSTDIIASVAYLGAWTGDTNQIVHPNVLKHVEVVQGSYPPGSCPYVGATIWRVVQLIVECPSPPCDEGVTSLQS